MLFKHFILKTFVFLLAFLFTTNLSVTFASSLIINDKNICGSQDSKQKKCNEHCCFDRDIGFTKIFFHSEKLFNFYMNVKLPLYKKHNNIEPRSNSPPSIILYL